jgi:hypothetical protein
MRWPRPTYPLAEDLEQMVKDKLISVLSEIVMTIEHDEYDDGYTHEAMHAAMIACELWDNHVLDTRCAEEFPDVKEAIEKAAEAMGHVYNLIGQKFKDD